MQSAIMNGKQKSIMLNAMFEDANVRGKAAFRTTDMTHIILEIFGETWSDPGE